MKVTTICTGIEGCIFNFSQVAHLHKYMDIQFDELGDMKIYKFLWIYDGKWF
jgi:hypothetical protein